MRKSDNSLHFFLNGVDIKKSVKTIPSVLYAVVDVYGQAEKVTLTGKRRVKNAGSGDPLS